MRDTYSSVKIIFYIGENMKNWLKELFLSLTISPLAFSAEMPVQALQDGTVVMEIYGNIEVYDGRKFINIAESWRASGNPIKVISLNSGGGSVLAGELISNYILQNKISTFVFSNSTCASACFNIFIAGYPRIADNNSQLGVHRISSGNYDNASARYASIDMNDYYKNMGVPDNLRLAMLDTPPQQIYWLSNSDKQKISTFQPDYSAAAKQFDSVGVKTPQVTITNNSKAQSRSLNREAISLIRNNNFALAISKLEQAKSLNPADSEILGNLGYAYYMSEDLKNAQINFTASLKITPKRGATWGNLADLLAYTGQIDWSVQAWINYYNYSKNKQAAQGQFDYVLENYPNTNNAIAVKQAMTQLGLY
ncbi:hypothetical protein AAX15_05265 [Haemophilus haemolyticus]|nr:hypothetical protein AAX15_05265 [Haemophilus haemolyticus]